MAITDPRDISGLLAWYSPEHEEANYNDGDQITTLTDLSGNGNHATGATTSTAKPLYKATGGPSGGAERIRFENGGYFNLPSGIMGSSAAGEIMCMIQSDYAASGTTQGFHDFGTATQSNHYGFSGTIYDDFGLTTRTSDTPTLSLNAWRRLTIWSAASDWDFLLDGTSQGSYTLGTVGWATVPKIGNSKNGAADNTATNTFEGDYGAIVLYSKKLSSTERSDLATWMAANPSGGTVNAPVAVGQTTETDSALPMTHATTGTVGQASESDIAWPMSEQYVGNAVVEIAFNSGYSTPEGSRTWTDVSDYVEAHEFIEITYGRQDEFSTCDANTCRVTLDNSDGRFTARRASSPYYPNVKIGRPLRVTVTRPGGSASVRFIGYIDDWPLEWDGTSNYAKTQISATSRMARLGADRQLRSIVEEEILAPDPERLFTMGEAEGATSAADSSGNSGESLTMAGTGSAVAFGTATGPSTDGLTAATFAAGKYLRAGTTTYSVDNTAATLSCFFAAPAAAASTTLAVIAALKGASGGRVTMSIDDAGHLEVHGSAGWSSGDSAVVTGGSIHHAAVTTTATTQKYYLDGVQFATESIATAADFSTEILVGACPGVPAIESPPGGFVAFAGTVAHVAVYDAALSATQILAIADAGLTGFEGETPGERVERYATQAAVPLAEIDADAGTSPMAHVDTTGQSTMDMLRVVETTENGVLHDGRDNHLRFHDRTSRYLATSAFTLSMTAQQIENGFVPKVDRTGLLNDVTATLSSGTVTARAVDQTSVDAYGRKSLEIELATTDVNEPHAAAWSRVNTYAEPWTRIPAVSVDLLPLTGTLQDSVLAADVGTRFAVTGIPSQAETTSGDFFVEGYTEAIGHASHMFTFNVSDAAAILDFAFVLDSATRGVLDTNRLAY